MKNTEISTLKLREGMAWLAIVIISAAVVTGSYFFHFAGPIKALVWIGWFVLILVCGFFTSQGKKIYSFSKEAKIELEKVIWPTRQETIQTTSIVMVMVTVTGFVLWGIDSGMMWSIGKITHLG